MSQAGVGDSGGGGVYELGAGAGYASVAGGQQAAACRQADDGRAWTLRAGRAVATADFHGLRIARKHGIPAPEPVLLDSTGELLGVPGIVTTFVEGTQNANPSDPKSWAKDIAELLLQDPRRQAR